LHLQLRRDVYRVQKAHVRCAQAERGARELLRGVVVLADVEPGDIPDHVAERQERGGVQLRVWRRAGAERREEVENRDLRGGALLTHPGCLGPLLRE
jgi:hypothetical protein